MVAFIKRKVGKIGSLEINIPIIKIGSGKPKLSIIAGIHGNETTGLFVIRKLLKKIKNIKGTIEIIPSANPFAQATRTRVSVIDNFDLNRIFSGQNQRSISEHIANNILKIVKNSNLVIDLHSFDMETPLMGILIKTDEKISEKNKKILEFFSPKQIWVLDTKGEEKKFEGSLGFQLNKIGITNIAIEMNQEENFSEEEIEHSVEGILRIMKKMKMINLEIKKEKQEIKFFKRREELSEESGIFTPSKNTNQKVKKGEIIGVITTIPEFREKKIKSHFSGKIMQISRKKMIMPGEKIAAIGMEVK